jgi:hypothetical protein
MLRLRTASMPFQGAFCRFIEIELRAKAAHFYAPWTKATISMNC